MESEIIIVSGLPRSGTSLMMQMLDLGGVEVVIDRIRTADTDNPRGYYEFEQAKSIKRDITWLPQTRGKAFKMVSALLYDLPATEKYRIVFMERDFDEMLSSQEKMLERLGRKGVPREQMKEAYLLHLGRLHTWLERQPHMSMIRLSYNALLAQPTAGAERVTQFLDGKTNPAKMIEAVDPSLYRNRKTPDMPAPIA